MIELGETALRAMGFRVCRVRHHDTLARLEFGHDEISRRRQQDVHERIERELRAVGYLEVTVDPRGYRERGQLEWRMSVSDRRRVAGPRRCGLCCRARVVHHAVARRHRFESTLPWGFAISIPRNISHIPRVPRLHLRSWSCAADARLDHPACARPDHRRSPHAWYMVARRRRRGGRRIGPAWPCSRRSDRLRRSECRPASSITPVLAVGIASDERPGLVWRRP